MAIFVIGLCIGLFMLAVALFNWESFFADNESLVIEYLGGEGAVRWYWGLGGLILIGVTLFYWLKP
jgi:hypothetical protein